MEEFSILNVLFLSVPEFFLCLMFSIIIIGEGRKAPFKCDNKIFLRNFFKMLTVAIFISLFDAIADHFIANMTISTFIDMVFYCIILRYVYKISWKKSSIGVVAFALLMISLESMYVPFCIRYFYNGNQSELFNSNEIKRFLCFLPVRLGQIIAIVSIWNFNFAIQKIKQYKLNLIGFIIILTLLFFFEVNITNVFISYFSIFNTTTKIIVGICCLGSGIFNFMILYMYIKVITSVSKFHLERSKEHG